MKSSYDFSNVDYDALRSEYESRTNSWFKPPRFTDKCLLYFKMIESVYRVLHADGKWRFMNLQPHQLYFHSKDLALMGKDSKTSIVVKSRNTSFTTDSIIRLFNSFYEYKRTSPVIRINEKKVKEIISEMRSILKHMRPIRMPDGSLFPFDPNKAVVGSTEILLKDCDIKIVGYTSASPDSAENIRGNRSNTGLLDEINFASYWDSIWGAMNGANPGANMEGEMFFQVTLGTTLRGITPFLEWFLNVKSKPELLEEYDIMEFPVFDPKIFDPDKPPSEQPGLKPITFWHSMKKLNAAWIEDKDKFMEEYMCVIAPTEGALFNMKEVVNACTREELVLQNGAKEYLSTKTSNDYRCVGVDCAGDGVDFFSVAVTNHNRSTGLYELVYLFNEQRVKDPDVMVDFILSLYHSFDCYKIRIDANDLGYFIAQKLKRELGSVVVESLRGNVRVKNNEISMPVKEFAFNHLIKQVRTGKVSLVNDDLLLKHFTMWKKDYSCERSKKDGHGDSVDALKNAMLPLQWKIGVTDAPNYDLLKQIRNDNVSEESFGKDLGSRLKFYRKNKKKRGNSRFQKFI